MAEVDVPGGDSMAARLARQRQQRSMLRTSNLPLEEAAQQSTPGMAVTELQMLRTEVADSGATISRLQAQLKESEAEMEEMGSRTARMAAELAAMRERADVQQTSSAPAAAAVDVSDGDAPMQVSISMPENSANPMDGVSVHISIGTLLSGEAHVQSELTVQH